MEVLYENLLRIAIAMGILSIAWSSNFFASLYYNVRLLTEAFEIHRLKDGVLKLFSVVISTALFAVAITLIPIFLQYIGTPIPNEYVELLNIVGIIGVFMKSTYMYLQQAYKTINDILEYKKK